MLRTTPASRIAAIASVLISSGFGSIAFAADSRAPRVGERAPDFELALLGAEEKVRLEDYRGEPVVLIFGSFT